MHGHIVSNYELWITPSALAEAIRDGQPTRTGSFLAPVVVAMAIDAVAANAGLRVVALLAGGDLRQQHIAAVPALGRGVAFGTPEHAVTVVAELTVRIPAAGQVRRLVFGQARRQHELRP